MMKELSMSLSLLRWWEIARMRLGVEEKMQCHERDYGR